jgi:hypothetical protein
MSFMTRAAVAFAAVVVVAVACVVPPASAQTPVPAPAPAPAVEEGWTQIDVWQKGINPVSSPYPRDTRTAMFTLRLKNPEGEWVEKEFTLEMTKGKTFAQMAMAFADSMLKPCVEMGWQFSYSYFNNSISIFGVDAGNDPHTDNPTNYPDSVNNRPHVRVETHKYQK